VTPALFPAKGATETRIVRNKKKTKNRKISTIYGLYLLIFTSKTKLKNQLISKNGS